ncbi:ferric reductase like transmembrane component-domain-containing protein [Mycena crocata]|nr:ferric reductase like transmembrane component-domain-containing protein [Mycena crocata]
MARAKLTDVLLAVNAAVNQDKVISKQRNKEYPLQVWYLLASFIAFLTICNFAALLYHRRRSRKPFSAGGERSPSTLQKLPSAAVHVFRTLAFRCTVHGEYIPPSMPRRFDEHTPVGDYAFNFTEFFLACAYIAVIFTWALINSTNLAGERFHPRYYANRSGFIAASQFPLLIALGMKNNIISFLTGVSFDKLNLLHRVVARVLMVLLWLHGGGRLQQDGKAENMEYFGEAWFRWGWVAVTALTMLSVLSFRPIRNRGYEFFLIAHFFVVIILLVGSYIHTKDTGEQHFVWPSFIVWGLDRFVRFMRTFVVNGGYLNLLGKGAGKDALAARVEVVSAHLLRVTLYLPDRFSWTPGQIAYLSVPRVSWTPWQSHPFTIASIDAGVSRDKSRSRDTSGSSSPQEKEGSAENVGGQAVDLCTPGYSKELVFLLRVRNGFTKRLLDVATNNEQHIPTFTAFVDGPYCTPPTVRGYGTVLLFAGESFVVPIIDEANNRLWRTGGSGVSFTLPLLLDLIHACKTGANPACGRVVFVWALRHIDEIAAISDTLCRALAGMDPQVLGLDIRIHVTTSVEDTDGDAESAETDVEKEGMGTKAKLLAFPCVHVCEGRPTVDEIVSTEVGAATGAVSVNVCGTRGLSEHVRRALRAGTSGSDVLQGGPSVCLHVEAFGNA